MISLRSAEVKQQTFSFLQTAFFTLLKLNITKKKKTSYWNCLNPKIHIIKFFNYLLLIQYKNTNLSKYFLPNLKKKKKTT